MKLANPLFYLTPVILLSLGFLSESPKVYFNSVYESFIVIEIFIMSSSLFVFILCEVFGNKLQGIFFISFKII
jgi:hypothetical protein